jgi:Holliday junction resolvase RusA-like endonuclease
VGSHTFFVPGVPRSTQTGSVIRAGHALIPTRRGGAWSKTCRDRALQTCGRRPLQGPLGVWLMFHMPRPKKTQHAFPLSGADLENMAKGLMDAWQGVLYDNDRQVVWLRLEKMWAGVHGPGVTVHVYQLEGQLRRCAT